MSNPKRTASQRLDGNAAAGSLAELFGIDLTTATLTCGGCGHNGPLAGHVLYPDAPALVLRCPACSGVVLRYAATDTHIRLDMSGASLLTVAVAPSAR